MKIEKYIPANGFVTSKQAEIYGRELHRLDIENKANGGLTPDIIVAAAKNHKSPLHAFPFDWDIHSAAAKHWKQQARNLVNSISVRVVLDDGSRHELPFMESIHVTILSNDGKSQSSERRYVTIRMIEREEAARDSVRNDAVDRLRSALQTIQDVARLGNNKMDSTLLKIITLLTNYIEKKKLAA